MKLRTWNHSVLKQPLLYLTFAFMLLMLTNPAMAQLTVSGADTTSAGSAFSALFGYIQNFAGVLLVIGVVIGGLLWMANKPQIAVGVLLGTAIVFGGPYIINLIHGGLSSN